MEIHTEQRLVAWAPLDNLEGKTPSFGDLTISSPSQQSLFVTLPYEEGSLCLEFKETRAFMTSWDGDENPFVTMKEAVARPSDICKVEASRWLSSDCFSLGIECALRDSDMPWEHFYILSGERSVHIVARDHVKASWIAQ